MPRHPRNPRQRLTKGPIPSNPNPAPEFDFNGTLYVLRDSLKRADTMVTCADELIVQLWSDGGQEIDDISRRRGHVSFLMESASLAILTAIPRGHRDRPAPERSMSVSSELEDLQRALSEVDVLTDLTRTTSAARTGRSRIRLSSTSWRP